MVWGLKRKGTFIMTEEAEHSIPEKNDIQRALLVATITWSSFRLFEWLLDADWIPIHTLMICLLRIPLILFHLILIVTLIINFFVYLFKKRLTINTFIPIIIMIGMFYIPSMLPSKPAAVFYKHRQQFVEITQNATDAFRKNHYYLFQNSELFEDAHISYIDDFIGLEDSPHEDPVSKSAPVVIEYITEDFYLPLVYISSDNPEDVHDTCSDGGIVMQRIEKDWYVCQRDWN
jgi:hypothetical protein